MNKGDLVANSKSEAINELKNIAEEIVEQILKLFIYQNSPHYHQWKHDLTDLVIKAASITYSRSKVKFNQVVYFNSMNDYIETEIDLNNKYKVVVSKFNLNGIRQFIENIEQPIPYIFFVKYLDSISTIVKEVSLCMTHEVQVIESEIVLILEKYLPKFY